MLPDKDELISRRGLLLRSAVALAAASALQAAPSRLKVAIFSKHLQFVQGEELARTAASIGFDAVDLTVRKGGHVEPERVKQQLPGLVATLRRAGLEVPMITTDIVDADSPFASEILKSMSDLGIRKYRWGGLTYESGRPFAAQLEAMKPRVAALAALNARYGVCAMYHTHSGVGVVGAPIWDLYILLKDFNPEAVGVNYDIGHATAEGGVGGWIDSFEITKKFVRGIAVKDFLWGKDAKGAWMPRWCPLGEGMVPLQRFFPMVAASGFDGPLQLHFEYKLGDPAETAAAMKRDLGKLRQYLAQANL